MFLVGIALGMIGLLFQRSFEILRALDDKERTRQASRMGLDRITSELRESTAIINTGVGVVEFEKIDPTRSLVEPPKPPVDKDGNISIPDDYVPTPWGGDDAYPADRRLRVRYTVENETLIRTVQLKSGGDQHKQVVVVGVNAFTSTQSDDNLSEVAISLSVRDNRRVTTVSGTIMAPCIVEEYGEL